jgi:hypothetical protein
LALWKPARRLALFGLMAAVAAAPGAWARAAKPVPAMKRIGIFSVLGDIVQAAGALNAELPAWLVKTIDENQLIHLLLVTRTRGTMDAQSGDIVGTYDIRDAYAYASKESQGQSDPWSFMPPAEKVKRLRDLVEEGMTRGTRNLLRGS